MNMEDDKGLKNMREIQRLIEEVKNIILEAEAVKTDRYMTFEEKATNRLRSIRILIDDYLSEQKADQI